MSEALSRLLEPIDGKPGPFCTWARFDPRIKLHFYKVVPLFVQWLQTRPDDALAECRLLIASLAWDNRELHEEVERLKARPSVASVDAEQIAAWQAQVQARDARKDKRIAELEAALAQRGRR